MYTTLHDLNGCEFNIILSLKLWILDVVAVLKWFDFEDWGLINIIPFYVFHDFFCTLLFTSFHHFLIFYFLFSTWYFAWFIIFHKFSISFSPISFWFFYLIKILFLSYLALSVASNLLCWNLFPLLDVYFFSLFLWSAISSLFFFCDRHSRRLSIYFGRYPLLDLLVLTFRLRCHLSGGGWLADP